MKNQTELVIGISVGLAVGFLLALCAFIGIRWYKKQSNFRRSSNDRNITTLPIRTNGIGASIDSSASISNSITIPGLQHIPEKTQRFKWSHQGIDKFASTSGILRYAYKDIQKATQNFTTILGQGSFGPVYKATMPTGGVVAVKVLAADSKQGEREFQTEVSLLGRLHHRNLVNLVGYCVDKGQRMLLYEFMSNGSLENLLYSEGEKVLSWDERLQIASDISHGIEYLHDGAVPAIIHRDLKSANILLDKSMNAKVADFGLSKEEAYDGSKSGLKGTYGYIDPEYISTNRFTKKSDIYSLGIILFELITAIHPHQNLMEYVDLAEMSPDGVDEILDRKLVGKCNLEEVKLLASIGHRCLHKTSRRRPTTGDVSQAILKIKRRRLSKEDTMSFALADVTPVVTRIEHQQVELSMLTSMNKEAED